MAVSRRQRPRAQAASSPRSLASNTDADHARQRLQRPAGACWPRPSSSRASKPSSRSTRSRSIPSPSRRPAPQAWSCPRIRRTRRCRSVTISTRWRARSRRTRASSSSPTLTTRPAPGCRRRDLAGVHRAGAAHALVALDEAYFEYSGGLDCPNGIELARRISRTSSSCARSRRPMGSPACASAIA